MPDKVTSYSVDAVIRLAKHFPQLEIGDLTSLDTLRDRFYTLSHGSSYSDYRNIAGVEYRWGGIQIGCVS